MSNPFGHENQMYLHSRGSESHKIKQSLVREELVQIEINNPNGENRFLDIKVGYTEEGTVAALGPSGFWGWRDSPGEVNFRIGDELRKAMQ